MSNRDDGHDAADREQEHRDGRGPVDVLVRRVLEIEHRQESDRTEQRHRAGTNAVWARDPDDPGHNDDAWITFTI